MTLLLPPFPPVAFVLSKKGSYSVKAIWMPLADSGQAISLGEGASLSKW